MNDDLDSDAPIPPALPPSSGGSASSSEPSSVRWYVMVPGCPLGRVKVKGLNAAAAEANYRSIAGEDCNPKTPAIVEIA